MLKEECLNVGAVPSSGSRLIPILSKAPENVVFFDISSPQIEFCKFRLKAIESLDHGGCLGLVSLRGCDEKKIFSGLAKRSENFKNILTKVGCDEKLKKRIERLGESNEVSLA